MPPRTPAAEAYKLLEQIEQPNGAGPTARFKILDDVEIESEPDAQPLIEGICSVGTLVSVVAPFKSFKSFLLLDWALCIATGRPWHGRRVRRGWVLYICAEGSGGMRKRVSAWKLANEFSGLAGVRFVPQSVTITESPDVAALLVQLEQFEESPVAIVVDTVARNFRGNENTQEDMSRFVAGCDQLRVATGATVFAVHHTGWAGEHSRGSTALPAAVDTEITLARDGDRVTVKCTAQKDDAEFPEIRLDAIPVGSSLVLMSIGPNDTKLTKNERAALEAVHRATADNGLPASEWQDAAKLPKSSFFAVRTALLERGYVNKRRGRYFLTPTGFERLGPRSNGSPEQVQGAEVKGGPNVHIPRDMDFGPRPATARRVLDRHIARNYDTVQVEGGSISTAKKRAPDDDDGVLL